MSYALDISQYTQDQSGPLTDDSIQRCLARGIDRFIVSTADKGIAHGQIAVLARHPVEIETYHAYEWASLREAQAEDVDFIGQVRRNAYNLQKHYIDLEAGNRATVKANIADCNWAIRSFEGICPVGLYTSPAWWMQYMGNTDRFKDTGMWFAHWNGLDSLDMTVPFGGWTRGTMHQTLANLFVEGIWCDTNYYERATPPPPPPPPIVEDITKYRIVPLGEATVEWTDKHDIRELRQKVRIIRD